METINVIHGRLTGPTTVELDEPVPPDARDAEVWLKVASPPPAASGDHVFSFLRGLPAGTSSKAQLDARVRAEKEEWEGR